MSAWRWVAASAVAGCVHVDWHDDPPAPKPHPVAPAQPDPAGERARLIKADYDERQAEAAKRAAEDAQARQAVAARARAELSAPTPPPPTCTDGQSKREALYIDYVGRREARDALVNWEAEHCRFVDSSHPVVRVGQDSNGEYHAWEGYSEAVHRECNAKPPKGLDGTWARNLPSVMLLLNPDEQDGIDRCLSVDAQTISAAAKLVAMRADDRRRQYARHPEWGPVPTADGGSP